MIRLFTCLALLCTSFAPAVAQQDVTIIVDEHILPGFQRLADRSADLSMAADASCAPDDDALRAAYQDAFDAWIRVSHLRFGPTEMGDRAFALAFWPDSRGKTPKALTQLITESDPVIDGLDSFQTVSVAARGFYGMEFMLYEPEFMELGDAGYRCALIRMMAKDIADLTADIVADWQNTHAPLMRTPDNDTYRDEREVVQQLFTALLGGLEFTSDMRLGRPLGSFDKPRPNRAEARRSGRSQDHVALSLQATRELAALLSGGEPSLDDTFARALKSAWAFRDADFSDVADPSGRVRVEALRTQVEDIRASLTLELGPSLGISAGFNSLDGD